ncbi:hypothetical protein [Burkholderia ambifaria]|uniref:Uncharacterized protein n=1 Tax=Burkholderia ambifaria MEX-5 TaxID=396597 RepID=B1T1U8_9BURK|nr:hypothetical protein [Burkholderia ambifaria]EDT42475.1 hypothetical protein BamMEX5DRAFT_1764 [Burkholderia ambifaria MEX-5]
MNVAQFEATLSRSVSPSSEELGGLSVVRKMSASFVESVYADRIVQVLSDIGSDAYQDYVCFAVDVLRQSPYPSIVAAVGQKLADSGMSRRDAMTAQDVLLLRARQTATPLENEMASECMAGAFLLASEVQASKPALIAALDRVEPGDSALLVRRVALLAGLAWFWSRSEDAETTLRRLAEDDNAGEQAAFELGMIQVDYALSSPDKESLFARLEDAAGWFESAERIDPDMLEATAFRGALRALMLFCDDAPVAEVEKHLKQACEASNERIQYLDTSSMRKWLRPRLDIETTWYRLSCALQGLSASMSARSWLHAVPVLQQIATLRSTLVSLATESGDILRETVTRRLASGFVAQEGLRAHLEEWAGHPDTDYGYREHALSMLKAVEIVGVEPGKVAPLASEGGTASGTRPDTELLEQNALLLDMGMVAPLNATQEKSYWRLISELERHSDFHGSVAADVKLFIIFLIRFLSYCLNVNYDISNLSFSFLFHDSNEFPLEKRLQAAMFESLHMAFSGFKSHQILREVPDFAKGRTDIAIVREDWTLVTELKREMSDATRGGLKKYLGQAAAYLLTGPRISFLVVVDLCLQKKWPLTLADNCWVESVQTKDDSAPRKVVVFRIPGMLPVPSDVVTPPSNSTQEAEDALSKRGTKKTTDAATTARERTHRKKRATGASETS